MSITYIYWMTTIAIGLVAGLRAPVPSWKSIGALELIGACAVISAALIGVKGDISSPLLKMLLLFDASLVLKFGSFEYLLLGFGYMLVLASTCLGLRRSFQ